MNIKMYERFLTRIGEPPRPKGTKEHKEKKQLRELFAFVTSWFKGVKLPLNQLIPKAPDG